VGGGGVNGPLYHHHMIIYIGVLQTHTALPRYK
jgi:hypothetical protein